MKPSFHAFLETINSNKIEVILIFFFNTIQAICENSLIIFTFYLLTFIQNGEINSSEISEAFNTIDVRKTAMQGLWHRIQRISPYVELKEKVDYNKDLASDDAKEVLTLIKKTSYRNLKSLP